MADILRDIIARNRAGETAAIPSVCSAHPDVLRASMLRAAELSRPLVIEATSNQVNQHGGYTGMTPADFVGFVEGIARESGLPKRHLVLGGDHLGPQVWRAGSAADAMREAGDMVEAYVLAGFTKIHLDCSEGCAGEAAQVDDATSATRAAHLARRCLEAAEKPDELLFVVGTEVPPPGGARSDDHGDIPPTRPEAAAATLAAHVDAFDAENIGDAWSQVGGLVVQPGVEFTPMHVHHLPKDRDPGLKQALKDWPGICLEAHSTDYQTPDTYIRLADLGFAFQKVGPALTFAWREAVYGLDMLHEMAGWGERRVQPVMERLMTAQPKYWEGHYHGDAEALHVMRHFGLADRIRYYWPQEEARAAVESLLSSLADRDLPAPLLSQVFASDVIDRAEKLRASLAIDGARAIVLARVQTMLDPYFVGAPA